MGCVYCKDITKEVKLSESDIIPDALTNNKILFNNVCEEEHNNKFSRDFEQKVIKELAVIRNRLLIFSSNRRGKVRASFPATVTIDGMMFDTKITTKYNFFNSRPKYGKTEDGQSILFVTQDNFDITKLSNIREIDINNCEMHLNFEINHKIFYSSEMKRQIAKIGFEWFCKESKVSVYDTKFKKIVDYIVNNECEDDDIVKVVNDDTVYEKFETAVDVGGHALGIFYSDNKEVYVYVSLFNILIYRVRIYKLFNIWVDVKREISFYGNWADGNEMKFLVYGLSGQGFGVCDCNNNEYVTRRINIALNKMFSQHFFSLKTHRFLVEELRDIFITETDQNTKFNKLLGFIEDEKIITLRLLYEIGINETDFNTDISFNENLHNIRKNNENIDIENEQKKLAELFWLEELERPFLKGVNLFIEAHDRETKQARKDFDSGDIIWQTV